jgi:acyl-coenzyme A thioesterase PaaI-like protein
MLMQVLTPLQCPALMSVMRTKLSLQQLYAPDSSCFGCGPKNDHGLGINSYAVGETVIATFTPKPFHQACDGVLNGGIIGTLLDCHCNWAASHFLMHATGLDTPPCTVTADYHIKLLRPCPGDQCLALKATLSGIHGNKAITEGLIAINDKVFATCKGTFVAVKEGHPAFHRW